MRKCDGCSYLTFGDGDVCKHCGSALPADTPAALVTSGAPAGPVVAAAAVAPSFVAPAPPPSAPDDYWVKPRQPSAATAPWAPSVGRVPTSRAGWSPTEPAPLPTAPTTGRAMSRVIMVLVAIISVALGRMAFDRVFGNANAIPAGTSAFVAGRGVEYSSPDLTFTAKFPSTPTVQQKQFSNASASATLNLAQVQTDDYEVVGASMVLPAELPADQVDTVLHEILTEGVAAQNAKIVSEHHVTHGGARGIEVRAKVSDGYDARLMALNSGSRIYMLGVHAKVGTQRLYDALVGSFVVV